MISVNKGLLVNGALTMKIVLKLRGSSVMRGRIYWTRSSNGVAGRPVTPYRLMIGLSAQA